MPAAITQSFDHAATQRPTAPAVSWRKSLWTYAELQRAVNCVTARLGQEDLRRGSRIALLLGNSPHYIATLYGILAADCIAVPLNVQERAAVLLRQIGHADCSVLIADRDHPELPVIAKEVNNRTGLIALVLEDEPGAPRSLCTQLAADGRTRVHDLGQDDPAMIIFTSGTTANPKGVTLSHRNLEHNARAIAEYLEIQSTDRVLSVLPFHFSYGNSVLNSNLICGAHLLLEDNLAFPHLTLRRMQDEQITGFAGVPATFALLLGRCSIEEYRLDELRYLTQAGGAMPRAHIEQIQRLLPRAKFFIMYGQTEATARLTYLSPELLSRKIGSVGRPLPGVEIEIRANGRALSSDEVGEICARGPNIMLGYWRDPAQTAEVLRDGWLHTGDLGHFDDEGFLYVDGRAQEMIKVGAFRVSPQEVEEVVATCVGVEEVAVVAMPDDLLGQAIKAIVVPKAGTVLNSRTIKAHCKQRLANYKVPKVIEFVDSLPRTSSGKVQRFKLG